MPPTLPPYDTDPVEAFWMPGRDTGLYLLADPQPLWRPIEGGKPHHIAISEHQRINNRWLDDRQRQAETRLFNSPVEYNTVPVVVENLQIVDNHQAVNGRWLICGPAGERVMGAAFRHWKREKDPEIWVERFSEYFNQSRERSVGPDLWNGTVDGLDFVIEARNLKNYFHFTRETFSTLALIQDIPDFTGRIKIVCDKTDAPSFVWAFINALFPELKDRVEIIKGPQFFERAITVWYGDFPYFQSRDQKLSDVIGETNELDGTRFGSNMNKILYCNGHSRALRKLRQRALQAIDGQSFDHLPRRFWLGRRSAPGRDRSLKNEAEIIARLEARGFGRVFFEDLSPLAQIGVMNHSEMMISYHGAGFTNMMYAAPETHVIELGTLQSGLLRWGDFIGFAHVSGAAYTVAVADYQHDGGKIIPPMRGHGLYPVRITDTGIDAIMAYIDGL